MHYCVYCNKLFKIISIITFIVNIEMCSTIHTVIKYKLILFVVDLLQDDSMKPEFHNIFG